MPGSRYEPLTTPIFRDEASEPEVFAGSRLIPNFGLPQPPEVLREPFRRSIIDHRLETEEGLALAKLVGWSPDRLWGTFQTYQSDYSARAALQRTNDVTIRRVMVAMRFSVIDDPDTLDSHRLLDGVIAPIDDDLWEDVLPPLAWGCRCRVHLVSETRLQRTEADPRYQRVGQYLLIRGMGYRDLRSAVRRLEKYTNCEPSRKRCG